MWMVDQRVLRRSCANTRCDRWVQNGFERLASRSPSWSDAMHKSQIHCMNSSSLDRMIRGMHMAGSNETLVVCCTNLSSRCRLTCPEDHFIVVIMSMAFSTIEGTLR